MHIHTNTLQEYFQCVEIICFKFQFSKGCTKYLEV